VTYHLEQGQISAENVVEVNLRVIPRPVVLRTMFPTPWSVHGQIHHVGIIGRVATATVASTEQIHTHNAEDEPKDEAYKEHVEYSWYRLDQCVYYHLKQNTNYKTIRI